jgi:sulfur carrier protein
MPEEEVTFTVNGDRHTGQASTTIADVVSRYGSTTVGIAVALNREVLARGSWGETTVTSGDQIEIVTAAAGG